MTASDSATGSRDTKTGRPPWGRRRPAIVLGGGYGALGVVRALAKQGIPVVLLYAKPDDHACGSRFVSRAFQAPDPMKHEAALLELLMRSGEPWDGALLVPTLDEYVIFVSQHSHDLRTRYVFSTPDWGVTSTIVNKDQLYPQARRLGVPTPQFFCPDSRDVLHANRNEIPFPCILKPYESHKFDLVYGRKMLPVHDFEDLCEKWADVRSRGLEVMICEIIAGADSSLFHYRSYIDSRNEVLAELCTQKLRQYPRGFGQAAAARTVPMIGEMRDWALAILRSTGFRGQSSAEFKLDPRDNRYKLMEINVRPVVPEWHFVAAGVNFPYLTYLDLVEDTRVPSHEYTKGLYWLHNYWETVNLAQSLREGSLDLGEFIQPYLHKHVFVVPFLDDPWHFVAETWRNARRALGKASRKRA